MHVHPFLIGFRVARRQLHARWRYSLPFFGRRWCVEGVGIKTRRRRDISPCGSTLHQIGAVHSDVPTNTDNAYSASSPSSLRVTVPGTRETDVIQHRRISFDPFFQASRNAKCTKRSVISQVTSLQIAAEVNSGSCSTGTTGRKVLPTYKSENEVFRALAASRYCVYEP